MCCSQKSIASMHSLSLVQRDSVNSDSYHIEVGRIGRIHADILLIGLGEKTLFLSASKNTILSAIFAT